MQHVNGANNADITHNGKIISFTTYFLNLFMVPVFSFPWCWGFSDVPRIRAQSVFIGRCASCQRLRNYNGVATLEPVQV